MIIEMPNTRTREISQKIDELHEERGESATGRVLTLLISTTEDELEQALELATPPAASTRAVSSPSPRGVEMERASPSRVRPSPPRTRMRRTTIPIWTPGALRRGRRCG